MRPRRLFTQILVASLFPAVIACSIAALSIDPVSVALCALGAACASIPAIRLSTRLSEDLAAIRGAARKFADGEYAERLWCDSSDETADLASALNRVAKGLRTRLHIERTQKDEIDAVLATMTEGVIVADTRERVVRMNRSALEMSGWSGDKPEGRTLQEVFRNPEIHRIAKRITSGEEMVEARLDTADERCLRAYGRPLGDDRCLLVLQDITRMVRLEEVRRDFVANVSHELKTPITSIKGFVETLLDGKDDNPEERRRFLEIISRQVDRLNTIFDDLLALSRIERLNEASRLSLEPENVHLMIDSAMDLCHAKAERRRIDMTVDCDASLEVPADRNLLEQAILNLIDNALKYSPEGSRVSVSGSRRGQHVAISVADDGPGIPARHLPRIFERFYRVDSGRSRDEGGTGLGLAIVKHITEGHGGRIEVESFPGKGSRFTLLIPLSTSRNSNPADNRP